MSCKPFYKNSVAFLLNRDGLRPVYTGLTYKCIRPSVQSFYFGCVRMRKIATKIARVNGPLAIPTYYRLYAIYAIKLIVLINLIFFQVFFQSIQLVKNSSFHFKKTFPEFPSIPTKQWFPIEDDNEIVMQFLLSLTSSLDLKPLLVPIGELTIL